MLREIVAEPVALLLPDADAVKVTEDDVVTLLVGLREALNVAEVVDDAVSDAVSDVDRLTDALTLGDAVLDDEMLVLAVNVDDREADKLAEALGETVALTEVDGVLLGVMNAYM